MEEDNYCDTCRYDLYEDTDEPCCACDNGSEWKKVLLPEKIEIKNNDDN